MRRKRVEGKRRELHSDSLIITALEKSAERDGKKKGFFTSDEFCPRLPVIFLKTPSEFCSGKC